MNDVANVYFDYGYLSEENKMLRDTAKHWQTMYENLKKDDDNTFYTELRCSEGNNILDCMKNDKAFFVEYDSPSGTCIYQQCRYLPHTYDGTGIEVDCTSGRIWLELDKVIKTAYTAEDLL